MKCSKGNEQFSILRNSLLSTFQKSQQIKHLWISIQIPIWKRKILILNSVSGDDKSCVKFTAPVGENVAINLGSNGFPIVNSLAPISTHEKLHSSPNSSDLIWNPFSGYELEGDLGVPPRGSHFRARHKNHSQVSLAILMMVDDGWWWWCSSQSPSQKPFCAYGDVGHDDCQKMNRRVAIVRNSK